MLSYWKVSKEFLFPETVQRSHEICHEFDLKNKEELAPQIWEAGGRSDIVFCFPSVEFHSLNMAHIICWVATVYGMLDSEM